MDGYEPLQSGKAAGLDNVFTKFIKHGLKLKDSITCWLKWMVYNNIFPVVYCQLLLKSMSALKLYKDPSEVIATGR